MWQRNSMSLIFCQWAVEDRTDSPDPRQLLFPVGYSWRLCSWTHRANTFINNSLPVAAAAAGRRHEHENPSTLKLRHGRLLIYETRRVANGLSPCILLYFIILSSLCASFLCVLKSGFLTWSLCFCFSLIFCQLSCSFAVVFDMKAK